MNKLALVIIDGFGIAPPWGGNAVTEAHTPIFQQLWRQFPHASLEASGEAVGLPANEMGNSEVGHLNLGAGRIVEQDAKRIRKAIADKSFFSNPVLKETLAKLRNRDGDLHLLGLLSDADVHAHILHLFALLEFCAREKFANVYLHIITDGRDMDQNSAIILLTRLEAKIRQLGVGKIATISGRYYTMDRDHRWDRTDLALQAMVNGSGNASLSARGVITSAYQNGVSDEYIKPSIIVDKFGNPIATIKPTDGLIFFNIRADRSRQISIRLLQSLPSLIFTSFVTYGFARELHLNIRTVFEQKNVQLPLSEVISRAGHKQVHIAETEKYAHVTYFFNGGKEEPFVGEERILVPSPKVAYYNKFPAMSSQQIARETIASIRNEKFIFIVTNFANVDIVGHTGDFKATVKAITWVDRALSIILQACQEEDAYLVITSDHGNAEEMLDPVSGKVNPEHTLNKVPLVIIPPQNTKMANLASDTGRLGDVAPTILSLLGINSPAVMTGKNLFIK